MNLLLPRMNLPKKEENELSADLYSTFHFAAFQPVTRLRRTHTFSLDIRLCFSYVTMLHPIIVFETVRLLSIATRLDTQQFARNRAARPTSVGHFAAHHARRNENRFPVENCAATHLGIPYQEVRSLDMNALLVFFAHTALV